MPGRVREIVGAYWTCGRGLARCLSRGLFSVVCSRGRKSRQGSGGGTEGVEALWQSNWCAPKNEGSSLPRTDLWQLSFAIVLQLADLEMDGLLEARDGKMSLPLSHMHGLRNAADLHNCVIGLRIEGSRFSVRQSTWTNNLAVGKFI